jgi:hypothetical protein
MVTSVKTLTQSSHGYLPEKTLLQVIKLHHLKSVCIQISVADNFGVSTYGIFLFLLTIWWACNWEDATACPYTHIEDVVLGNADIRTAVLVSAFELAGGMLSFK